jgi:Protein of unknown function (DUF2827)
MKKINIGITLSIDPKESIFSNGIRQNILILRELYEKCENVENAYIVNTSGKQIPDDPSLPLYNFRDLIIDVKDIKKYCNVVVVAHGTLFLKEYEELASSGIKIVKLILGPTVSLFNEHILFKGNDQYYGIFNRNKNVNKVWMSAHYFRDRYFFETIYGCEAKVAPYVWDPRFIEKSCDDYEKSNNKTAYYQPNGTNKKRILNFEPNLNMVKTSTQSLVVVERFFRQHPELVADSYFFNSATVKEKKDFIDFVKNLDIYQSKKLSFEGGMSIVPALAKYGDIVVANQNQNELNYLYLDAAWLGYPILHNSEMMKEIGFYYENNNAQQASEILYNICQNFDKNYKKYKEESREKAKKYMITNEEHIKEYSKLINELMD